MNTHCRALFAILTATGLVSVPIIGTCAESEPQVRVPLSEVNLSTAQGVTTLYGRLRQAAAQVCGEEPAILELSRHRVWTKCVRAALDGAVAQVDSPALAALHASHGGKPVPTLAASQASKDH